jgi:hypothetical protein
MLPPIVPALRTCSPPKRRINSSSCGESRPARCGHRIWIDHRADAQMVAFVASSRSASIRPR